MPSRTNLKKKERKGKNGKKDICIDQDSSEPVLQYSNYCKDNQETFSLRFIAS